MTSKVARRGPYHANATCCSLCLPCPCVAVFGWWKSMRPGEICVSSEGGICKRCVVCVWFLRFAGKQKHRPAPRRRHDHWCLVVKHSLYCCCDVLDISWALSLVLCVCFVLPFQFFFGGGAVVWVCHCCDFHSLSSVASFVGFCCGWFRAVR